MTLIVADSFDNYDVTASGSPWAGTATFDNVAGRDAIGQCLRLSNHAFAPKYVARALPSMTDAVYITCSVKLDQGTAPPAGFRPFLSHYSDAGTLDNWHLKYTADGTIQMFSNSAGRGVASAAPVLLDGQWITLEIYALVSNAGAFTVKANGVTVIEATGVDLMYILEASPVTGQELRIWAPLSATDAFHHIDNLTVCDTAGAVHNSFLGDVRFAPLVALTDTAQSNFTDVGAGASSAARINDALPNEATYLSSSTVGHKDRFTIAPIAVNASSIVALAVTTHAKKDGGGDRIIKTTIDSGGTLVHSSDIGLGDSFSQSQRLFPLDPLTGLPWVKANADAIEVGFEIVS